MYKSYALVVFTVLPTLFSGAIAATVGCTDIQIGKPTLFQTSDIQNMANNFATGNIVSTVIDDRGVKFNPHTAHTFKQGGFQICLQNPFLFAGTHVRLGDISSALNTIVTQCCKGQATCQGGDVDDLKGDTGITIPMGSQKAGDGCHLI